MYDFPATVSVCKDVDVSQGSSCWAPEFGLTGSNDADWTGGGRGSAEATEVVARGVMVHGIRYRLASSQETCNAHLGFPAVETKQRRGRCDT